MIEYIVTWTDCCTYNEDPQSITAPNTTLQKCGWCIYQGPITSFPHKANLEYKKNCSNCLAKVNAKKKAKGGAYWEGQEDKENDNLRPGAWQVANSKILGNHGWQQQLREIFLMSLGKALKSQWRLVVIRHSLSQISWSYLLKIPLAYSCLG